MFDSYSCNPKQSISINAVNGAILKNHPKSWFERFHLKSRRSEVLLCEGGHQAKKEVWNDCTYSNGKYKTTERDTEKADKVRAMMGNGKWGDGAPEPTVKQAVHLSRTRTAVKKDLATLAGLLKYRMNELGYDPYWQRFMCMNWDDFDGCTAGRTDCDSCTEFRRIREQYCARCGCTFYERAENRFCPDCRKCVDRRGLPNTC